MEPSGRGGGLSKDSADTSRQPVSLPQSAGTKHQGDLMDKTLRVIRFLPLPK